MTDSILKRRPASRAPADPVPPLRSCELMRVKLFAPRPWVTAVTPSVRSHRPTGPVHSVGTGRVKTQSAALSTKVVISPPESLIRVLSCHLISLQQQQTAQSTPSDQSSSLHTPHPTLLFSPLLSIMVNPTSIRKAPFNVSIPRGGLITPGCFVCLFLG